MARDLHFDNFFMLGNAVGGVGVGVSVSVFGLAGPCRQRPVRRRHRPQAVAAASDGFAFGQFDDQQDTANSQTFSGHGAKAGAGCRSPCRTFNSNMRLHVTAANSHFYPDVLVTCSVLDLASPLVKTEPKLIAEVLSASTAAYDRGLEFSHYRSLASLQEYVLIDLDTRSTDCYRKGADGLWVLHPFARGEGLCWPAWRWN